MKLFKYDNSGTESYLNLDQVVSFGIEKPTMYGTTLFLVNTTAGIIRLSSEDKVEFLKAVDFIDKLDRGSYESK